jgi:hypothetical protein
LKILAKHTANLVLVAPSINANKFRGTNEQTRKKHHRPERLWILQSPTLQTKQQRKAQPRNQWRYNRRTKLLFILELLMFSQLITNADGRLSTTAFIQFFGALLMAGILVFCVWLNRSYVPELFTTFALFCGGGAATKGFANAMQNRNGQGGNGD